jgi:hypothetical protein
MIRRGGPKVEQLPALKLYREDLEGLISLFQGRCQHVRIADENNFYDSLSEMEEHGPSRLQCFILSGAAPHAELVVRGSYSVTLGVQRSTLWIMERNEESELLFLAAADLLRKRTWLPMVVLRVAILSLVGIAFAVGMFAKSIAFAGHKLTDLQSSLIGVVALGGLLAGGLVQNKQPSYISLAVRSRQQSFWERNHDLIRTVIGAIIGALITLIVTWIKSRF